MPSFIDFSQYFYPIIPEKITNTHPMPDVISCVSGHLALIVTQVKGEQMMVRYLLNYTKTHNPAAYLESNRVPSKNVPL